MKAVFRGALVRPNVLTTPKSVSVVCRQMQRDVAAGVEHAEGVSDVTALLCQIHVTITSDILQPGIGYHALTPLSS